MNILEISIFESLHLEDYWELWVHISQADEHVHEFMKTTFPKLSRKHLMFWVWQPEVRTLQNISSKSWLHVNEHPEPAVSIFEYLEDYCELEALLQPASRSACKLLCSLLAMYFKCRRQWLSQQVSQVTLTDCGTKPSLVFSAFNLSEFRSSRIGESCLLAHCGP